MSGLPVVPPSPNNTIACGTIFPIVSGVVVALRFYCRHTQHAKLLIDDWMTIPAWFFLTGMGICLVLGVYRKGFAYPSPVPSPSQDPATFLPPEIIINRQLEFAIEMMQFPALTCVKLSFLFFYKRIFCNDSTRVRNIILWIVIILCTVWGVAFFFNFMFVCGTDFVTFWGTPREFKAHCGRVLSENFWLAITDFALDVVVFGVPIPMIWSLHLSTTRKFAILSVFAVGALAVAASITRMVIFVNAVQVLKKAYKASETNTAAVTAGMYWTVFECGLGLTAACMPAIYVLLKRLAEFLGMRKIQSGASWTWRTDRAHPKKYRNMDNTTLHVETVPMDTIVTINTKASKDDEEEHSTGPDGRSERIVVSKNVSRV